MIIKNNIEFINTTPTRFKLFMEYEEFRKCISSVKIITLAGEALSMDLCKHIHQYSNCKILNGYGPTECTITSTYKEIDFENDYKVTIGKPQCNYKIYILDKYMKPVPIGVEGEIYIGGYGVGKGYLNREDLTYKSFINCPFNKSDDKYNEIMYKTGDLGKWTRNGEIEYLGRIDFQVKIHGQRIELGEIESIINEMKEIKQGIVIDKVKSNGEKYLVCYYQLYNNDINEIEGKNIREYLKNKLPTYMIPNYYKKINNIPLTVSGKLNRKELPEINIEDIIKDEYVAPETEVEKCICYIYSKIFNINENEIGKTSDFFELGGDSLNAIRLISIIEKELKVKLNIKDIYESSIVVDLSNYIEKILNSNDNSRNVEIIDKRNSKEFPITSQQLGVYIDSIKNEGSIIYNIPFSFKLIKNVNIEKIKYGFNKLFQNQEILRTKYYSVEINGKEEIYGYIDDESTLEFEEYTYENAKSFVRPFDLSKAPLIRVGFIKNEVLLIDMHHIISDGTTISIIINEINKYYNRSSVSELEVQFSDYAIHMNEIKNSDWYSKQIEFYKEMFKEEYEITNIPHKEKIKEYKLNGYEKNQIGNCEKNIDTLMSEKINEYIRVNRISKTVFFLSIYGYILSKYSGKEIIYTSMMNANRNNHYLENMIGMFVSTQPILLKYNKENISLLDVIKENMKLLMELYNNQDISFSELINTLKLKKVNNSFIFQPKGIVENNDSNKSIFSKEDIQNIYSLYEESNEFQLDNENNTKFDITFNVIENEEGYLIAMEYNKNLYESFIIENIMNSYVEVIKHLDKFNENIQEIECIPKNELERIIIGFNNNYFTYDCDKLYHVEFSHIVKEKPESIVIVFNDIKYKYRELNEMSNSLAHYLRRCGIGRNDIIPIISDRSPYYIISMIAVSKAGGAFLPIDPKLPIERINYILEDVNPKMILYNNTQDIINKLVLNEDYKLYDIQQHNYKLNTGYIENINEPDDICYVLFTSGTTGKPKGVIISHFNIFNYVRSFKGNENYYCMYNLFIKENNIKNILSITNFSFDPSHIETINSLINGLNIILADENIKSNISLLSKYIIKNNVELIKTTPTVLKLFMDNEEFRKCVSIIKAIVLGGEILSNDLCKYVHQYSKCRIYNEYGPTECTVACSGKLINEDYDDKISIGKPFCNCQIFILDKYLKPLPIGVEGEIYIGGYGVGKGYINNEELTNEKFIKNPFNKSGDKHNEILYRTGDLGKWKRNGEIEYLGRIDFQVKIHGQRIELEEIESIIQEINEINQCVVIDKINKKGEKYLICYFISEKLIKGKEIREYLKNKLPSYMIPNYFKQIEKFQLTSNGKLDRKSLPEPNIKDLMKESYSPPINETEEKVCEIFSQIFNIHKNEIGRFNDFYEFGGDSFKAIQLCNLISKSFNIKVNIKDILSHPIISEFSEFIENKLNKEIGKESEIIDLIEIKKHNKKEYPITSQQMGVYIDSIKNPNSIIYNIPEMFQLNKSINIEIIKEGFQILFNKQEILRSKYSTKEIDGKIEIYGYIDDECSLIFEEYTYENAKTFVRPFDLSKAPLIRVGFIKNEVLLIDMHHIISDGITMTIIINEINKYYNGLSISELEIQFSDYAIHMNEMKNSEFYSKQIEFYKEMFKEDYEITNIPKKEREIVNEYEINKEEINEIGNCIKVIDNSMSKNINEYIKTNSLSKTAFFISIYGYILSKYSEQEIIYTSMMSANRNNHYLENMIGMFVSTQPILLKYNKENIPFLDAIKENMEIIMELYNNQDISFSELINTLKLKKVNNSFIFQPKDIVENNDSNKSIFSKEDVQKIYSLYEESNEFQLDNDNITKFDITFNVIENEEGYLIAMEYNKNLYESFIIENIMNSYVEIINHLDKFNGNIQKIEYISKEEKEKIITKFNNNNFTCGCDKLYHVEFSRIVKERPESIVIVFNDIKYKYRELNEMSNSLAHYLRRCGIGRNDIIPIISDRSPYYIISMIAISKAGGAFLPIDPKLPIERIHYILEDVNPKMILYNNTQDIINKLVLNEDYKLYDIQQHNYKLNTGCIENINKPNDICYVLFTSGTTGKPKGTLIKHFNIYNNIRKFDEKNYNHLGIYNLIMKHHVNNVLGITNFSFDISHNEITFSLIHGLTIILIDDVISENIKLLSDMIIKNNIEFINTTPTRFKLFMEYEEFRKCISSVKIITLAGEALSMDLCKHIHQYSNCKILNGYGPTECTITSTYKEIDFENDYKVTIGKPQCNYKIYILDKYMKPVPIGVEGEIYIGGYGVGKGYLNREDLTYKSFINCPFNKSDDKYNEIMYKTGDLGKWTRNGEIEYLGRIDFQVKIHGQRIELGEIESIINEMKEIKQGIVIDKVKSNGEKYLVCYYQLYNNDINEIEGKNIREYLKNKLPTYMIPNYYKKINNIPLTVSGKLNRKELPEINIEDIIKDEYVAPETEVEKCICYIYSKIFNINENEIGKTSDFFELGGDSLNAIRLISIIEKELKVKLNIKDIYESSIVVDLSNYIEKILNSNDNSRNVEIIDKRNSKEFPITSQQLGVYIDSIKNEGSIIYNIPFSFKLIKNVNIEKIKYGFNKLFQNQEILRTKYYSVEINGKEEIYGYIDDESTLEFEEYTYENAKSFVRPFDLSKAPLIRVGFIKNEVLLIDMHHIISDGTTMSIIINEINKYYNGLSISELEVQFSDYAIHMNEIKNSDWYSKQIEFYKNMFKEEYEIINISQIYKAIEYKENNEYKINENKESEIGNCEKNIDTLMSEKIDKYIKDNRISKTVFFLSIYGYILSKYSGKEIVYTSIMSANRNNHYLENMIGMFVSTQPILLKYNKDNISFLDVIKENMKLLMELYNNQDISFSELINTLKLKKVNNSFIFQPKSIIENNDSNKSIFSKEDTQKMYSLYEESNEFQLDNDNTTKFDITFNVIENEEGYLIVMEYNKNLYESFIIENIMNNCIEIIKHLDKFNENIQNIEYIPKEEKEKIINKFNDNDFIYDCDKLYHVEFSGVAKENPESIALIYNNTKYKYRELDEMSNSLAYYLREHGIGRNDIIPIICERTPYYIIGTLAISKAGGAFLPIDPKYPLERIKYILDDVKPSIILTYNVDEIMKDLKQDHDYNVYKINNHDYEKNRMMLENINSSDDTCYVLFTSGTTGKPKGAMVSHFNIYNFIRKYDDDKDRINMYNTIIRNNGVNNMMAIANFPFDLSHIEITFSLIHGLTIVFADEEMLENISDMGNYIKENQIEFITTTPTRFKLFMENEEFKNQLKQIKVLIFIGESLPLSLCKEIHKYSECRIYNSYGPTECSVTCTLKEIDTKKEEKISIGKPMTNCKVYILDKYKKPVPIGVVGYIYIGGFGVGKGYLGRPELTKEMFIQCPFNNNSNGNVKEEYEKTSENINNNINLQNIIMYNTGDLGKWNNNGEIEYLGRADFQVKIKGHRIELGEIENTIKEIQEIEQCAVIDRKNENEEKLPVTRNGKLDRKVLPEPDINDIIEEKYVKPVNEIEEKICEIYSQIFNIDINKIGRTGDFLELGGDSLQAIRVATFIEKKYKVKIYMKDVLSHSTIFDLGKFIDYKIKNDKENEKEIHIIKKYNQKEYPITSQQMGVYIDSIKNPNSTIYNIPRVLPLNKSIDIKKIKEGFNKLFNEQNILRSKYIEVEIDDKTEIHGYIDDECSLIFEEYTYDNAKTFVRPFDLSNAPLIRVGFIENEVLLIDMHHIISDGTTMSIIINEINKYYNGLSMSELEVQFSDYAIHMNEMKNNEWYSKQIEFYKKMFNEEYEMVKLPQHDKVIKYKINENEESEIGNCDKYIDTLMSEKINEYIRINKISKTSFFLSIYGYILSKYSGQEIIYTSVMSANRNNHYLENMIGMFVSTQPILLKYDQPNKSFLDILKENMEILMELYNNQDISFSELINTLKLKKVSNAFIFQPKGIVENIDLFESIFSKEDVQNIYSLYEESNEFQLDNENITKFDITFNVIENEEGYLIAVEYNKNIYESFIIENIMNSYVEIIKHLDKFNGNIQEIEYIPKEEKEKIITKFNDNIIDYNCNKLYHVEFSRVVKKYKNKTALISSGIEISYSELDKMSNSLAHYLRKHNIGRGDIIPIISERSFYFVIGTLAIMKSGAAYLPIDPDFPKERIEYMVKEVNPKLILKYITNIENNNKFSFSGINIYSIENHNYNENTEEINNINESDDLCYVLFTSGTTGKPKGTLITHNNLINYCLFAQTFKGKDIYGKEFDNILAFSKFTFDMSLSEIQFPLLRGCKIILCNENEYNNPKLICELIKLHNIYCIYTVPSRLENYINDEEFCKSLKILKWILFGGEKLSYKLINIINNYSDAIILNGYGPTETTVCSSIKCYDISIRNNKNVTIGKPNCNYKIYILDKMLKPVPIGVEGEIFISGYGVGKGYLNQPELTKEKFIDCPYYCINNKPCTMYRTGDLGKWNEEGEIICLGRIDFQVKIRGQRIELSEIENTIKEMKEIEYSTVIDRENEDGNKYLVCYFISEKIIKGKEIREYLKNKLPSYMIPNYFVKIDNIPITSNGKLDRKSLPEPNIKDLMKESYSPPINETEEKEDSTDFYEFGGDSFKAIQLYILSHPIISEFSEFIENKLNKEIGKESEIIDLIEIKKHNKKEYPITSQQMGVYIDSIKNPNSIIYNIPEMFQLNKSINIEIIKEGFQILFNKQEILRSKYSTKEVDGKIEIYGYIDDECSLIFEEYTYENAKTFVRPFDLSKAPLIRVGFIKNEVLLIDMHHIISDGITMTIIINEINKYYNGLSISELEIQFSDYAIHMNEMKNSEFYSKQIEFYKEMFKEDYEITTIPKKEREIVNEYEINKEEINEIGNCIKVIDNSMSKNINEYIKTNSLSKTAFFISIYGYILSKYSGQEIIYTSMMSANRNNHYLENMIGMFVSTQPILLKYNKENISFLDILKENMEIIMEFYNNQDISFSELINTLKLKKVNNAFIFQPKNIIDNNISNNSIISNIENEKIYSLYEKSKEFQLNNENITKFDITINVIENEEGYLIAMDYNKNIYESFMIENIMNSYVEVIKHLDKFNGNIQEIEYIPKEKKEKIVTKFNDNNFEYGCDKLYHVEFSRVAKENKDKIAIICSGIEISYSELDEMSNSLAHYLRKHNIGRGDIIPIISERSFYFVIGTLAIMKSGAAYLPIDPDFPKERIEYMVKEVNPKLILKYITNIENNNKFSFSGINIYSIENHNYNENTEEINNINESDDLCYVLFTSGTTGKPKGTLITHNNLINYCLFAQTFKGKDIYGKEFDNILAFSKFTFDMSLSEIQFPLLRGCKIILCDENEYNNPKLICELIKLHNIYCIYTVPSRLENYINDEEFCKSLKILKWILFGGEKLSYKLINIINNYSDAIILNGYGPTETTVCSSIKCYDISIRNNKNVTIGKPNCNYKIYILDKMLKPVPIGVEGEIFISGYGVGKGYLNQPELTKEKFIECPYYCINNKPCTMYRTGDLGKWNEEGEIICLGRIDFQVKIRGQRIELSEIENTIKEMKEIEYSTVIDRENEDGNKYLVCYFISEKIIKGKEIREYLKEKLPSYMIPNYFVKIDNIPITSNGKLDRKSLPEPNIKDLMKESYSPPINETEEKVCEIFSQIFNIHKNEVGRFNDFYEFGGDSFKSIQMISKIKNEFSVQLKIKDIMTYTTIESLAKIIDNAMKNDNNEYKIHTIKKYNKNEYPITTILSSVAYNTNSINFEIFKNFRNNMVFLYKLNFNVNEKQLENAFNVIINRHQILKTIFVEKMINGEKVIYGKVRNHVKLFIEHYTINNYNKFIRPFDITKDLLIRVGLIDNLILMIDMDHKISDGYSSGILISELYQIYNNVVLDDLPIQYSDYAIYYDEKLNSFNFENQLNYYSSIFNEQCNALNLPRKDYNNKTSTLNLKTYKNISINTNNETYNYINYISKKHNISKTSFFLTIYSLVLSIYSGQNSIFIAMMNSNRTNYNTENLIGLFVKFMPILIKIENIKLIELIKKSMNILLNLYNFDIPFSKVSEELNLPLCNSWFRFHPYEMLNNDNNEDFIQRINYEDIYDIFKKDNIINKNTFSMVDNKPVDIQIIVTEMKNSYNIYFEYNADLYDEKLIINIINSYTHIIKNEQYLEENVNNLLLMKSIDICDELKNNSNKSIRNKIIEMEKEISREKIDSTLYNDINELNNSPNINTNNKNKNIIKKLFKRLNQTPVIKKIKKSFICI
ncbi:acetyl-CoA synthetase-like protein [Anaeromyces robustus]|uniref:Acetyl-CoA synthetase-like protein n=1 Tax=Anaeromyces robustus TaxID=1754192 RepID=A0A1Y1WSQ1_9FUNG|nr:acetyl-CoA synthetase-like protein [Anaeromyces robustus]|eukprot:ORX76328.1 acetyl-CoA synthetase-like protein [Anaeromyces robustus]